MAHHNGVSGIASRMTAFVARHPRLVATLLALTLLLAIQDAAMAADGTLVDTSAEASVDMGPDPDDD